MNVAPVRAASARLRCHCSMGCAPSKEMITYCVGGAGGSACAVCVSATALKAALAEMRQALRKMTDRLTGPRIRNALRLWLSGVLL